MKTVLGGAYPKITRTQYAIEYSFWYTITKAVTCCKGTANIL